MSRDAAPDARATQRASGAASAEHASGAPGAPHGSHGSHGSHESDALAPLRWGTTLGLLLLCAVPLLMRLLSAKAAFTDGFYAHSALMLARGYAPYTDFTQVAFPVAEGLLALAFGAFGTSLLVVELFNRAVVLSVAFVLLLVGRRLQSTWAGGLAALLWSWSTWVVHFNLFERETWVALGTSVALLAYLRPGALDGRRAVLVAWCLLLAFLMKITAVTVAAAFLLHLLLCGRMRDMLRLGACFGAGLVLVTVAGHALWGRAFLWQVYVFGFFRNSNVDLAGRMVAFVEHMDPTLALGLVGLVAWGWPRLRAPGGVLVLVLLMDAAYAVLASPTLWDHNMIVFAPTAALLAALWIDRGMGGHGWGRLALPAALVVGGTVTSLALFGPDDFTLRAVGTRFGLGGGRERAEIAELASFVRKHTSPEDVIECTEPWVAFAADRVKLVRYWDLLPVALGVEASLDADGLGATFAKRQGVLLLDAGRPAHDPRLDALQDPYVARLVACSQRWVRPLLLDALERRELAFVLEPYLEGLEVLTPEDLRAAGYERVEARGLAGWRPADGVSHGVVRPLHR